MNIARQVKRLALAAGLTLLVPAMAGAATSVPYQRYLNGSCPGLICKISFPVVPAGKRLEITNTSCYLRLEVNPDTDLLALQLLVLNSSGTITNAVTLPVDFQDSDEAFFALAANEHIFVFAAAGQRLQAYAELKRGKYQQFACHISGQLVTP